MFAGGLGKLTYLKNIVRQRLLAIHMLSHLDCLHSSHSVRMIRSGNYYCVDIFVFLIQHPSEVTVLPGLGIPLECPCRVPEIHIAQGDDILTADFSDVTGPTTANADTGYIELLARCRITGTSQHMTGNNRKGRGSRSAHKITSRNS
jgi:hypothetical protein